MANNNGGGAPGWYVKLAAKIRELRDAQNTYRNDQHSDYELLAAKVDKASAKLDDILQLLEGPDDPLPVEDPPPLSADTIAALRLEAANLRAVIRRLEEELRARDRVRPGPTKKDE